MVKDISYSTIIVDTDITANCAVAATAVCIDTVQCSPLFLQQPVYDIVVAATTAAVNDHSDWPLLGSTRRGWQRARPRGWPPRYSKQLQLTC